MKKKYFLILSFFIGIIASDAQTTCVDTIYYPETKMTSTRFQLISEIGNAIKGVSQTYNSNTGLIHGLDAYILLDTNGIAGDASPLDVYIKVFNVDALNRPIGSAIDSNLVTITDVGTANQTLLFTVPVAVSGKYAVGIELDPLTAIPNADTAWFLGNNDLALPPDGGGEALMALNLAFGINWTNFLIQYGSADYDALISPIFEKTITSLYTTSLDTICPGSSIVFTNIAVLDTNDMYNTYASTGSDPWIWNYDDGAGTYNHYDTTYAFAAPGAYNTQLLITSYGYTGNCVDSVQKTIIVRDTAVANFSFADLGGGSFQFSDLSIGALTHSWDFGDGSPLDITQSPLHLYTVPSNYTVCLTVTDTNGCNVDSSCQVISFVVGVDDYYASNFVKIYPIPADKYFNVTIPENYFEGEIILLDVVGHKIKSVEIGNQEKVKVSVDDIASGIYFVSIEHNGERVFTERIVIDR